MPKPEELALADICSILEYVAGRGEFAGEHDNVSDILTSVRYTPKMQQGIPHFDVVCNDRLVRVFAMHVGPKP